jgi:hypothetical protein
MSALLGDRLHRDVFPSEVAMPDGTVIRDARVFVTNSRLLAYQVNAGRIVRVLDVELEQPVTVPRDRGTLRGCLEARLADGSTAWINQGRGCGCGSPLKALASPVGW